MSGDERIDPQDLGVVLRIEGLAAGGRGVARPGGGPVWLVEGALPGDLVRAVPIRTRPRLVEGRAVAMLEAGPDRRPAPCPHQGACGGCAWMALGEAAQLVAKRRLVVDALARLGGVADPPVEPTRPSPRPLGYRNKVEFAWGRAADGAGAVGLHPASGAHEVVDADRCLLLDGSGQAAYAEVRRVLAGLPPPDPPARVAVRVARSGEAVVAVRGPQAAAEALAGACGPAVAGVVHLASRPGGRGGTEPRTLRGRGTVAASLGGLAYELPASVFFQVNPEAAEALVALVREMAGEVAGRGVIDLYAGVGVFGLALARDGARVTLAEADREAVACGERAAAAAGLAARFVRTDAAGLRAPRPDVVVADPPRTGLGPGVARRILEWRPERVVLVSCDPPTLGRDVRALSEGYRLQRSVPVDLFPQTPHVETVTLLTAAGPRPPRTGGSPPPASGSR